MPPDVTAPLIPHMLLRRRRDPKPGAIHVCHACAGDYVNPTYCEEEARDLWRVGLRCGACGYERETLIGNVLAEMYNRALDKGNAKIAATVARLDAESMAGYIETFTAALRHDLIDASDFETRGKT